MKDRLPDRSKSSAATFDLTGMISYMRTIFIRTQ
ncbi:MAG: hypothetical protein RLZZ444_3630 [Pseudomonadota bacterium]